ncbi:MAG: hypothetical protein RMK19_01810 [Bacteroidia bacterium]|nr:hypothetical protein [Bacteroidia bacterium]MDW8014729.1 hypothetical protein [Bacteroidia bacterium]
MAYLGKEEQRRKGFRFHFFPELDSTQALLHQWAEAGEVPTGTLIWTLYQRSGYGRKGTPWHATPGESLTFSFLLREGIHPPTLLARAALALWDAVAGYVKNSLCIKWPNDLWSFSHPVGKLAGLLAEVRWINEKPLYAIVGIGLNVYQVSFPSGLEAVSLRQIGEVPPTLWSLLRQYEDHYWRWHYMKESIIRISFMERTWRKGLLNLSGRLVPACLQQWDERDYLHFDTPEGKYILPIFAATEKWKARFSS